MLLRGDEVRQVLAGKRSALIVPFKASVRQPYVLGRSYAVRLKTAADEPPEVVARIVITHIEQSLLHEVDYRTMRKAGFKYREDLNQFWVDRHRRDPGPPEKPKEIQVLVVRFHLDRAASRRYLRPGPRGGYVETADDEQPRMAMSDEPECVPQLWQERHSKAQRERDMEVQAERKAAPITTPLPVRLALAIKLAERHKVDISRQLGIIGKRLEAIERTLEDQAA